MNKKACGTQSQVKKNTSAGCNRTWHTAGTSSLAARDALAEVHGHDMLRVGTYAAVHYNDNSNSNNNNRINSNNDEKEL